jgi:hypothetical protein
LPTAVGGLATDRDEITLGASYNFGVAKVSGLLQQTKFKRDIGGDIKTNSYMLGVSAPVGGVGEVKLQYALYDQKKAIDSKAHQITLGYVHNLSKRTALYGTWLPEEQGCFALGLQARACTLVDELAKARLACKSVSATLSNQLLA